MKLDQKQKIRLKKRLKKLKRRELATTQHSFFFKKKEKAEKRTQASCAFITCTHKGTGSLSSSSR